MPISSTEPAIREIRIDMTMPRGPLRAALRVSSVMCADASYPVNVYWASSSPTGRMYHQPMWNPDMFTRPVNTNLAGACCAPAFRPNVTAPTMISTPAMCHQTLTSFSSATSRMPNWFSMPCTSSTAA